MSKKKTPEKIWGAIVNQGGGCWWDEPKRFIYNDEDFWFNEETDSDIARLGLDETYGYITFGSTNKSEVEAFINGAKSTHLIMVRFLAGWVNKWCMNELHKAMSQCFNELAEKMEVNEDGLG